MKIAFPWNTARPNSMNGTDAVIVPTADQLHLILFGSSGQGDPLLMAYDIGADSWAPFRSDPSKPRSAVGATLDFGTGAILAQGGTFREVGTPLSAEIDILVAKGGLDQWTWSLGAPSPALEPIFQPIVAYLPTRNATLIIGGADYTNSAISSFRLFKDGYLITTSISSSNKISLTNTRVNLTAGSVPPYRLSPCYTVLENGDLFMYGGATFAGSTNDAWLLHAADLTWTQVMIKQNPTGGRAGAICQRISPTHIMVIGGYNAAVSSAQRVFAQPQIGIIDTEQWAWTTKYSPPSPGLSIGAIIGIIVGCCLMLGVVLFFAGRAILEKRKSKVGDNVNRDSVSASPLMGSESSLSHRDSDRFLSTRNLISSTSSVPISSKMGSETSVNLSAKNDRSPGLIIDPYPPSNYNSSSFSVEGMNSPERGSTPTWNSQKIRSTKSELSLPESERLPQTIADMQYGYYIKTQQHNKQYEKRRSDLNRQQPNHGLNRKITSNQYSILNDEYHEDLNLSTAVLQLKDVEMGEESIMIPLQTLETGTILVSSHLDDLDLLSSTATTTTATTATAGLKRSVGSTKPMSMRDVPNRFSSIPSKTELNDDDDGEVYEPGLGGSITMLKAIKAAKAKAKAEEALSGALGAQSGGKDGPLQYPYQQQQQHQQQQKQQKQQVKGRVISPLSQELISEESEILVDNRRGKRSLKVAHPSFVS
ncbi:hypothetical protein FBU30_000917 [Linnemannia zychae]|nr:hypothetical protein FBU30_000917 [Linnemannia zychae]